MNTLNRLADAGIIPVVVLDQADKAVPAAKALLAGGIDVMEITFRTSAAAKGIELVARECPGMMVGAGTVTSLDQCKTAVNAGAGFVVSPGFDEKIVTWCVENDIAITPGCVTPSEMMAAMTLGLRVVKFFPADLYGGLAAMKSLSAPFSGIKFIPTGGVNRQNVGEYISAPFVHAVGGSWVCPKADIAAGSFDKISALCAESRKNLLGYEVAHVGINAKDHLTAWEAVHKFEAAFGFSLKDGRSSVFASENIEIMKSPYLGRLGHLAVRTNSIKIAISDLEKKGFLVNMETAKYNGDKMVAVYLREEVAGFAIHLLQK